MNKVRTVDYTYSYRNRQAEPVAMWMAVPPDTMLQQVRLVECKPAPVQKNDLYGQKVWHFRLQPGDSLFVQAEIDLYSFNQDKDEGDHIPGEDTMTGKVNHSLSRAEREFYLRSSSLCPVNDEMRSEAEQIVGSEQHPLSMALCLFNHFRETFKYKYPPQKRGAIHFRETGKGDCGEFSFLYSSYMRSLGIPCRTVVGAFMQHFNPHVWNEVWIENDVWLPVDTSMAASLKNPLNHLLFPLTFGESSSMKKYFGHFAGNRVIFSLDADWPLVPEYEDINPPKPRESTTFGKDIIYGFQSLDGAAPYLQPIYIQFTDNPQSEKVTDLLGTWHIKESNKMAHLLVTFKKRAFHAFFLFLFAGIIKDLFNVPVARDWPLIEISYVFATIGLLVSVIRREANWLVYVLFAIVCSITVILITG